MNVCIVYDILEIRIVLFGEKTDVVFILLRRTVFFHPGILRIAIKKKQKIIPYCTNERLHMMITDETLIDGKVADIITRVIKITHVR